MGTVVLPFGTPPREDQVGIDAVLQGDSGHRCPGLFDQFENLALEGGTVSAPSGDDGGIRLLHGMHSGQLSAHLQWGASAAHTARHLRSPQERYSPDAYF